MPADSFYDAREFNSVLTKWCALYGVNLMEGVAGFGDTPEEAMRAFDSAWYTQKTPAAIRQASA